MSDDLNTDAVIMWFDDFHGEGQETNEFRFLSNFYVGAPLAIGGHFFQTGEHAFQAAKAKTDKAFLMVATADDPGHAKSLGRSIPLRADWEVVKYDVMAAVVRMKFALGRYEGRKLLGTGDRLLIEGTYWNDEVWGIDLRPWENRRRMQGRNWLGTLLMARRAELRAQIQLGAPARDAESNLTFAWPSARGSAPTSRPSNSETAGR